MSRTKAALNWPVLSYSDSSPILARVTWSAIQAAAGCSRATIAKVRARAAIRVVALDLPTSWQLAAPGDEFTARMFAALNAMMLDMLAAVARKDYEDRRRRQAQGIVKAKAAGAYRGRPEDT
jgi:DNA invertase Pin-like site-specific DNA recombinase